MENKQPKEVWIGVYEDVKFFASNRPQVIMLPITNTKLAVHNPIKYISEAHHNEIVEGLKAEIKQSNQENSHNKHTMEWYRHEITELKAEIESLKETTCKCDSRIGETKLWCCNQCGKRCEKF